MYVTINDVVDQAGQRRPYEIFINSKNMEHYSWIVALTRMISAVFRRGGNVRFVVEELKAIFDPRGGHWVGPKYVPSVLAFIGETIEKHMIDTGFISGKVDAAETLDDVAVGSTLRQCPECGGASIVRQEGCDKCLSCTYTRCG
jgi:ribonucleoside-diphosphate reductase alpha chain